MPLLLDNARRDDGMVDPGGSDGAAISNYQDMLVLNANDNQGIRYVLAVYLMRSRDIEALKKLLKQYDEDGSALWLYTQALVAFRENDASDKRAEELAKKAWKANDHVPAAKEGEAIDEWVRHHGR